MARIKLTKTEMKAQTDALKRFQRFLPMLQLKKQQLQAEIGMIQSRLDDVSSREAAAGEAARPWISLFAGSENALRELVKVQRIVTDEANIAGITMPVFKSIDTSIAEIDLFATPAWYDDAAAMVVKMLSLKAERKVLARQRELVTQELTTTSQRVNLFEKVKIPECKENIRVIKIAISDEQTAAVTRGKIAKSRSKKLAEESAA